MFSSYFVTVVAIYNLNKINHKHEIKHAHPINISWLEMLASSILPYMQFYYSY